MKDALGNEIIIGNTYGFARCDNGINTIKLGVVAGASVSGFASLKINNAFSSAYNDQPVLSDNLGNKKVNVKSFMLFPI